MILPQLYIIVLGLTTVAAIHWLRRQHVTTSPNDVSEAYSLSALELSYLMDGTPGFTRALLLTLERKGWLTRRIEHLATHTVPHFTPAPNPPPSSLLQAAEVELWREIITRAHPVAMHAQRAPGDLVDSLSLFGAQMWRDLTAHGLMYSPEHCQSHDARRGAAGFGIAALGIFMSLTLVASSLAGAALFLVLTLGAWRLLHHFTTQPRRTPSGELLIGVYQGLYEPMHIRRHTWRRFTPKELDYLRVIFSHA